MSVLNNISHARGEDLQFDFTVINKDVTDITGWTFEMDVRLTEDAASPLFSDDDAGVTVAVVAPGTNKTFRVTVTSATTLSVPVGTYYYDIFRTNAGNRSRLSHGEWEIEQEVSR